MEKRNRVKAYPKSMRLAGYNYSWPGAYFVTVCTFDKRCMFGRVVNEKMNINSYGKIVKREWIVSCKSYPDVYCDYYIVMPNHFHAIVFINKPQSASGASPRQSDAVPVTRKDRRQMLLPKIVGRFKMQAAKHINLIRNTSGRAIWQRSYYDHIIRNEEDLTQKREYIINNPIKWELDRFYIAP